MHATISYTRNSWQTLEYIHSLEPTSTLVHFCQLLGAAVKTECWEARLKTLETIQHIHQGWRRSFPFSDAVLRTPLIQ